MSRVCELSGISRQIGHKVCHSNKKSKREFRPNLVQVTIRSEALGQGYRLRVSAAALRTVDHRGGLDAYLLKAGDEDLSLRARAIKRALKKKLAESPAVAA